MTNRLNDPETCSLCLNEVEDLDLREVVAENRIIYTGARICFRCRKANPEIRVGRS